MMRIASHEVLRRQQGCAPRLTDLVASSLSIVKYKLGFLLFCSLAVYSDECYAGKLLLLSEDEQSAEIARRVVLEESPFREIPNFNVEVVTVAPGSLGCSLIQRDSENKYLADEIAADRLIHARECDDDKVLHFGAELGAAKIIVIVNDEVAAGHAKFDGEYAIMTSALVRQIPRSVLHEIGHLVGLLDEYEYPEVLAKRYCVAGFFGPNLTMLRESVPYTRDYDARAMHRPVIPWFESISDDTPITTGDRLGTPKSGLVGLYPSKVCDNATNGISAWRPTETDSIMANVADPELGFPQQYHYVFYEAFGK